MLIIAAHFTEEKQRLEKKKIIPNGNVYQNLFKCGQEFLVVTDNVKGYYLWENVSSSHILLFTGSDKLD